MKSKIKEKYDKIFGHFLFLIIVGFCSTFIGTMGMIEDSDWFYVYLLLFVLGIVNSSGGVITYVYKDKLKK